MNTSFTTVRVIETPPVRASRRTTLEKPRITLAQLRAIQTEGTVAQWIEKYIVERSQPGGRQIQPSQRYILRAV